MSDQLEVVVFGRCRGEAILVRMAEEYWVAIDSLLIAGEPVSLEYLRGRGIEPRHIRAVLATHWHADHYEGLAKLLRAAAPDARFLMPSVVHQRQLRSLAALGAQAKLRKEEGAAGTELDEILKVLRTTKRATERVSVRLPIATVGDHRLFALSPTTHADQAGLVALAKAIETEKRGECYSPPGANETSVATFLRGPRCAVLGADLIAHDKYGWASAVVESAEERGGREACLLKVPHHGSPNADDDALWEHLLETPATACVTSFGTRLPGEADLIRLQQRGGSKPHLVTTPEQPAEIAALCIGVDPGVTTRSAGDAAFVRFVSEESGWRAEHGFVSGPVRTSSL